MKMKAFFVLPLLALMAALSACTDPHRPSLTEVTAAADTTAKIEFVGLLPDNSMTQSFDSLVVTQRSNLSFHQVLTMETGFTRTYEIGKEYTFTGYYSNFVGAVSNMLVLRSDRVEIPLVEKETLKSVEFQGILADNSPVELDSVFVDLGASKERFTQETGFSGQFPAGTRLSVEGYAKGMRGELQEIVPDRDAIIVIPLVEEVQTETTINIPPVRDIQTGDILSLPIFLNGLSMGTTTLTDTVLTVTGDNSSVTLQIGGVGGAYDPYYEQISLIPGSTVYIRDLELRDIFIDFVIRARDDMFQPIPAEFLILGQSFQYDGGEPLRIRIERSYKTEKVFLGALGRVTYDDQVPLDDVEEIVIDEVLELKPETPSPYSKVNVTVLDGEAFSNGQTVELTGVTVQLGATSWMSPVDDVEIMRQNVTQTMTFYLDGYKSVSMPVSLYGDIYIVVLLYPTTSDCVSTVVSYLVTGDKSVANADGRREKYLVTDNQGNPEAVVVTENTVGGRLAVDLWRQLSGEGSGQTTEVYQVGFLEPGKSFDDAIWSEESVDDGSSGWGMARLMFSKENSERVVPGKRYYIVVRHVSAYGTSEGISSVHYSNDNFISQIHIWNLCTTD